MPIPKRLRYDPGHDLYVVMGASPAASSDELQRAFRQRAKEVHPDLHPDNRQAKQQFQALNDAYDILSNPQKRAEYDRLRYDWLGYRGTPPPIREAFRDEWANVGADAAAGEAAENPSTEQPDFSEWQRSRQPSGVFQAAWRSMMRSYSHRLLLAVLAFVLFANIAAVLLLPQVMWLFDAAAAAQASRTAEFYATQTQANRPQYIFVESTPRPTNAGDPPPSCANPNVRITAPADGSAINIDAFDIRGSADDSQFANYTVEIEPIAPVSTNEGWILSLPVRQPVRDGVLAAGVSIGNMTEGDYLLRLRVQRRDQSYLPACEVRVTRKK